MAAVQNKSSDLSRIAKKLTLFLSTETKLCVGKKTSRILDLKLVPFCFQTNPAVIANAVFKNYLKNNLLSVSRSTVILYNSLYTTYNFLNSNNYNLSKEMNPTSISLVVFPQKIRRFKPVFELSEYISVLKLIYIKLFRRPNKNIAAPHACVDFRRVFAEWYALEFHTHRISVEICFAEILYLSNIRNHHVCTYARLYARVCVRDMKKSLTEYFYYSENTFFFFFY